MCEAFRTTLDPRITDTESTGAPLRTAGGKQGPESDSISIGECNQLGSKTIEPTRDTWKELQLRPRVRANSMQSETWLHLHNYLPSDKFGGRNMTFPPSVNTHMSTNPPQGSPGSQRAKLKCLTLVTCHSPGFRISISTVFGSKASPLAHVLGICSIWS